MDTKSGFDEKSFAEMETRLLEIGARLEKWDNREIEFNNLRAELKRAQAERQGSEYQALLRALHPIFDDLCRLYPQGTEEQRARIRAIFRDRRTLLNHLCGYPANAVGSIRTAKDVERVRIGLAAASIENARTDIRDLIVALEELYRAAVRAGIDPVPHFREIGELSSSEHAAGGFTGSNMRDLLTKFHLRM